MNSVTQNTVVPSAISTGIFILLSIALYPAAPPVYTAAAWTVGIFAATAIIYKLAKERPPQNPHSMFGDIILPAGIHMLTIFAFGSSIIMFGIYFLSPAVFRF